MDKAIEIVIDGVRINLKLLAVIHLFGDDHYYKLITKVKHKSNYNEPWMQCIQKNIAWKKNIKQNKGDVHKIR